jgi:hypothetical protein
MLKIRFRYKDNYSFGEWREQECTVSSVEKCKEIYGLDGSDPTLEDYQIISVERI